MNSENELVTRSNWLEPPHNRWGFLHVADLLDTVPISNSSGDVTALPQKLVDLDEVSFTAADGSSTTWERHLNETFCDAVCVVHEGKIVDERYFNNLNDKSQHLLMSVTKSVTAVALGISIRETASLAKVHHRFIAEWFGGKAQLLLIIPPIITKKKKS